MQQGDPIEGFNIGENGERPPARLWPTPIFISSLDDQAIVQIRPVELEAYSQAGLATHDLKETCGRMLRQL